MTSAMNYADTHSHLHRVVSIIHGLCAILVSVVATDDIQAVQVGDPDPQVGVYQRSWSLAADVYKTAVDMIENGDFKGGKEHLQALIDNAHPFLVEPHYVMLTSVFPYEFRSVGRDKMGMEVYQASVHALQMFLDSGRNGSEKGSDNGHGVAAVQHDASQDVSEIVMAHFALAHYNRVLDNMPLAWKHLNQGARAKHTGTPGTEWKVDQELLALRVLPLAFPKAVLQKVSVRLAPKQAVTKIQPAPVLIIGLPRSGSTLLEQVLARHSAVVPGGEAPAHDSKSVMEPILLKIMQESSAQTVSV